MTAVPPQDEDGGRRSTAVLAERLAAALVHHEPGWRLPRPTILARRYRASPSEIDAAIEELAARHLVRRLPDGSVYRASPVEYRISLGEVFGLASHVDPMGGRLECHDRRTSVRRPPEDVRRTLGLAPGQLVLAVRCMWTVGGEPGALSVSYLTDQLASELGVLTDPLTEQEEPAVDGQAEVGLFAPEACPFPWRLAGASAPQPEAVQIEMGLPPPSAARRLRLTAGEAAATVTVSFTDPASGSPVVLTMTMLRADLFRVVIEATPPHAPPGRFGDLTSTQTQAADIWEP